MQLGPRINLNNKIQTPGLLLSKRATIQTRQIAARRINIRVNVAGSEDEVIKDYFQQEGFKRWQKIYGETDDVNKVQLDIRKGHAQTVEKVLKFIDEDQSYNIKNLKVCDMGCGTGSLTIPLIERGAQVYASDLSASMVSETEKKYLELKESNSQKFKDIPQPNFNNSGLEQVNDKCHTLFCLDVMIHYPEDRAIDMIGHLTDLASDRVYISYAPKTFYYSILKKIGELFPGPSKTTRAYLHKEEVMEKAFTDRGWQITNREFTATQFYFSKLIEAQKI